MSIFEKSIVFFPSFFCRFGWRRVSSTDFCQFGWRRMPSADFCQYGWRRMSSTDFCSFLAFAPFFLSPTLSPRLRYLCSLATLPFLLSLLVVPWTDLRWEYLLFLEEKIFSQCSHFRLGGDFFVECSNLEWFESSFLLPNLAGQEGHWTVFFPLGSCVSFRWASKDDFSLNVVWQRSHL